MWVSIFLVSCASKSLTCANWQSFDTREGIRFNCQHGQRECDGNMFQSCVLDVIGSDNQDLQTKFVVCAMDFSQNPQNCAKFSGVNLNKVNECMTSNKGIELQLKAETDSTRVIRRSGFVPTVNFMPPTCYKS